MFDHLPTNTSKEANKRILCTQPRGLGEKRVYIHMCNACTCNLNDHNVNMQVAHVRVHVPETGYETSK